MTGATTRTSGSRGSVGNDTTLNTVIEAMTGNLTKMMEKIISQMKLDQAELIQQISDKFNSQLIILNETNAELKCKVAVLEEKLASNTTSSQLSRQQLSSIPSLLQNPSNSNPSNTHLPPNGTTRVDQTNGPFSPVTAHTRTTKASYANTLANGLPKHINGTGKNCISGQLKPIPKRSYPIKIFVSRLDPTTETNTLTSYIESSFGLKIEEGEITKCTTKHPSYASFIITTSSANLSLILDGDKWPENILVKKFYEQRPVQSTTDDINPVTTNTSTDEQQLENHEQSKQNNGSPETK